MGILTSGTTATGFTTAADATYNATTGAVSIPAGIDTIDTNAFLNQTDIKSVVLPISLVTIGQSAFAGCSNLTSVSFAAGSPALQSIGLYAFYLCSSLTSISLPASLRTVAQVGLL